MEKNIFKKADVAMIGLSTMGANLTLNMSDKGYSIAVYSVDKEEVDRFMTDYAKGRNIWQTDSLKELIMMLKPPRKFFLMIKAGKPVDEIIERLLPDIEKGDLIIDGGNSHFEDTTRRVKYLEKRGILFIGTGISGGENGARNGASVMPGGNHRAWPIAREILQAIAASTEKGIPCCDWIGSDGAGHFVKMVHNGIEYGDMQLISEIYFIMKNLLKLNHRRMSDIFMEWNKTELNSYLLEITGKILVKKDKDGVYLLEKILDAAEQKGTGMWAGIASFEAGIPATVIAEAVFARHLSSFKAEREKASREVKKVTVKFNHDIASFIEDLRKTLLASRIVTYAQGFMLMQEVSKVHHFDLHWPAVATMWENGCIIKSALLKHIKNAFEKNPQIKNLIMDTCFRKMLTQCTTAWRRIISASVLNGIPVPGLSSAVAFYDAYSCSFLPANLLQAIRDCFGNHGYERVDTMRGTYFHADWSGAGTEKILFKTGCREKEKVFLPVVG